MKKILKIVFSFNLSLWAATSVVACSESYLKITPYDIYHEEINQDIPFDFMYNLPEWQQPQLDRKQFGTWTWNLKNNFTLTGHVSGTVFHPLDEQHKKEYWTINLRKTANKGLFVWSWQENHFCPWNYNN